MKLINELVIFLLKDIYIKSIIIHDTLDINVNKINNLFIIS